MSPPTDKPLGTLGFLLVTTGGLGTLRPAPGTWGSMPPVALAGVLILLGHAPSASGTPALIYHGTLALVLVIFSAACVIYGRPAEARFGKKDPGSVCADETAGQCIPLMLLPAAATPNLVTTTFTLAGAFVAFRIFDILKLPPANGLQRVKGGWGILLDDLVAGAQALIVVQLVTRLVM